MGKISDTALTKCVVYFNDGNARKFYSRDKAHKNAPAVRELGLEKLKKMLQGFRGKFHCAIFYDCVTDKEIARYEHQA